MAIFRNKPEISKKKKKNKYDTPLVPNSGGFYDSSIRGKTYEEYLESLENRGVAGIRITQLEECEPKLVKKLTPQRNTRNK